MLNPRDRDAQGRPKNARPRDRLGRPLPRGTEGEPPDPELVRLETADFPALLAGAQRLLDSGRPFEAHELLEAAWKRAPAAERSLWQALAQLAVGLTHLARGNPRGAAALFTRSAAELERWADRAPHGIAAKELAAVGRRLAQDGQPEQTQLVRLTR